MRELRVEDALMYLDQVKVEFGDRPHIYNEFLDIMKTFKCQKIDTPGVIQRVSNLFHGNKKLVLGFNTFLPEGYKIELPLDSATGQPVAVYRAPGQAGVMKVLGPPMPVERSEPQGGGGGPSAAAKAAAGPQGPQNHLGPVSGQLSSQNKGSGGANVQQSNRPQGMGAPAREMNDISKEEILRAECEYKYRSKVVSNAPPARRVGLPGVRAQGAPGASHAAAVLAAKGSTTVRPQPADRVVSSTPHVGFAATQLQAQAAAHAAATAAALAGKVPDPSPPAPVAAPKPVPVPSSQQQALSQSQPQTQPQPQQQGSGDPLCIQNTHIEFDHAINYVTTIKRRFANDPNTYKAFLEILHTYQKEQRGIKEVLDEVSELFSDHPDLLKEFTFFLPDAVQAQAKAQLDKAAAVAEARKRREAAAQRAVELELCKAAAALLLG